MSKYDQGKHDFHADENGNRRSLKRLDPQKPSPQLLARQAAHTDTLRTADSKIRGGYNKPGSQQKRSK
jgi:hypothetical protein